MSIGNGLPQPLGTHDSPTFSRVFATGEITGNTQLVTKLYVDTIVHGGGTFINIGISGKPFANPYFVSSDQSGTTFYNEDAMQDQWAQLPVAANGLQFEFIVSNFGHYLGIILQAGDYFYGDINSVLGGQVKSNVPGSTLIIKAVSDGFWSVSVGGEWEVDT